MNWVNIGSGNGLLPWLIASKVVWDSSKGVRLGISEDTNEQIEVENCIFKIASRSPSGQWVKGDIPEVRNPMSQVHYHNGYTKIQSLKIENWHDTKFVVIGGTVGCQDVNLRCHHWRKSWHHEKYCFLVNIYGKQLTAFAWRMCFFLTRQPLK